jgi:outer membrane protein
MNTRPVVALRAALAVLLIGALPVSGFGQVAPGAAQQPPATQPVQPTPAPAQPPTPQPPTPQPAAPQPSQTVPSTPPPQIQQPPLAPPMPTPPATDAPPASQAAAIQEARGAGPVRKMSVDEAVQLALEQNLDVQVERINPQLQDLSVAQAAGAWAPNLSGQLSFNSTTLAPDSLLTGASESLTSRRLFGTAGVDQVLPFGTSYSVGWDASRSTSNNLFASFNPRLGSSLSLGLTQPLLRGLKIDGNRATFLVQKKNREISDVALRAQIVQTMRSVRNAYWNLVGARYNLVVTQASLDISRQTLKDNRTRVEVGTMAPIDIVQAEAEVARNEESAIIAASQIDLFEDQLRALVFDPKQPEFWNMDLDLTEAPQLPTAADVDIEAAVNNALSKRTDLLQTRKNIEAQQINLRFYRDQLRPQLNATVDYGLTGLGGVQVRRGESENPLEPGPIISETEKRFTSVLGDLFGLDFPQWTLGAVFSMPLGNSFQKAQAARARLALTQADLNLRSAELGVATEVRTVGRNVNTNRRRVDSTRAARVLTERQLEAAQKKFSVGLATSLDVLIAQRDLTNARNNELTAIIDYVKSLVDFEAVQEAGTGGGTSLATGPTNTTNR